MKTAAKNLLAAVVVAATLFVATPRQAEARRWVYYYPTVAASPVVAAPVVVASPVVTYYPVVPRRAYRTYYAPTYVPAYPAPSVWYRY
jgi:hypothetical protein